MYIGNVENPIFLFSPHEIGNNYNGDLIEIVYRTNAHAGPRPKGAETPWGPSIVFAPIHSVNCLIYV